jgi:hypothetical protein
VIDATSARLDSQERTFVLGGEDIQETVTTLADVADSLPQLHQHRLTAKLLPRIVENDALDLPSAWNAAFAKTTDKQVAPPMGKAAARVERRAR